MIVFGQLICIKQWSLRKDETNSKQWKAIVKTD